MFLRRKASNFALQKQQKAGNSLISNTANQFLFSSLFINATRSMNTPPPGSEGGVMDYTSNPVSPPRVSSHAPPRGAAAMNTAPSHEPTSSATSIPKVGGEKNIHPSHHMESVLFSPSVPPTGRRIEKAPESSLEWRELAHSMTHPHQTVVVDGVHYNQVECILRALQFDPKDSLAWYELGAAILGGAKVGGYTAVGSFQQCVTHDAKSPVAWTALGSVMKTFDVIVINDLPVSKQNCFEKALALNDKDTIAWMFLADFLAGRPQKRVQKNIAESVKADETATVNGKEYNALDCYAQVLNLEPDRFPAWNNCGLALVGRSTIGEDGKPKTVGIHAKKTITVQGIKYNVLGAFIKAIEIDGSYGFVWRNLAVCIPKEVEEEFTVTIHDKEYRRKDLLDEAERLDRIAEDQEMARIEHENPQMRTPV